MQATVSCKSILFWSEVWGVICPSHHTVTGSLTKWLLQQNNASASVKILIVLINLCCISSNNVTMFFSTYDFFSLLFFFCRLPSHIIEYQSLRQWNATNVLLRSWYSPLHSKSDSCNSAISTFLRWCGAEHLVIRAKVGCIRNHRASHFKWQSHTNLLSEIRLELE